VRAEELGHVLLEIERQRPRGLDEAAARPETATRPTRQKKPLSALKEIIFELIDEGIYDDGDIAEELERRGVSPPRWSRVRVEAMRRFFGMVDDPDRAVRARAERFRQRAPRRR
jgi:hypothetical protein